MDETGTYEGKAYLTFFSRRMRGSNGSRAPDAAPMDTIVPLMRTILKFFWNLW